MEGVTLVCGTRKTINRRHLSSFAARLYCFGLYILLATSGLTSDGDLTSIIATIYIYIKKN